MAQVAVREATAADAAALERLIGQLGYEAQAADIVSRLRSVAEAGHATFVAELDGAVVGCLTTSLMPVIHRPAPVGRISMMVVEEGLRGQGIGAALVAAAEARLAAQGCYMMEVTSHMRRTEAHGFYEKLGYERTSVRLAKML